MSIRNNFLVLCAICFTFSGCQDAGQNNANRAEVAHAQCADTVSKEFDPVYLQQNPPNKTRDLDNDGVPDVIEHKMGLDLCRADSDADGLSDFHEAVIAGKMKPEVPINVDIKCENYGHNCDSDGDELSNFKETHGFYYSTIDGRFLSLPRLVPQDEWESLKTTSVTLKQGELNPWLIAINAIENSGHNRPIVIDNKNYFAIDLEKVRLSITQAFLNIYGDANHVFLSANSNQVGTVANIMNVLLAKPAYKKDLNGQDIVTYQTDPTKWSTDLDPYSDSQEISGVNDVSGILHPANHPLIAGYPRVRAVLDKILIVPVQKITDSKGNSTEDSWETSMTDTKKRTTGWSIGGSLSVGASKKDGPEVSAGISGGYSDTTTKIKSSSSKNGGKNKVDFKSATGISSVCAAHAWFTIRFENLGTAPITKLKPAFNLFFNQGPLSDAQKAELERKNQGKEDSDVQVAGQMFTFAPNTLNREPLTIDNLAPKSSSKPYTFPYVGESGANRSAVICLTLDQLAFLENEGGVITIDMLAKGGQINFWNQNTKRVVTEGNWQDYHQIINKNSAIVDYDLIDVNGKRHKGNYMAYAGASPRMSLAQAMKLMLTNKNDDGVIDKAIPNCPTDASSDLVGKGVCLNPNGDLNFSNSPNTFFAVHAFDQAEKPIPESEIDPALKQAILQGDVNNIYIKPHWRYQFISHGDIQLPYGSGARVTLTSRGYELTAWASDMYGSNVKAKICKGGLTGQSTQCSAELTKSSLSYGAMQHYTYMFPKAYNFTGQEHLLLDNGDGLTKIPVTSSDLSVLDTIRPVDELGGLRGKINAVKAAKAKMDRFWSSLTPDERAYATRFSVLRLRPALIRDNNNLANEIETFLNDCSLEEQNKISTLSELNAFKQKCTKAAIQSLVNKADAHSSKYAEFDRLVNLGRNAYRARTFSSKDGTKNLLTTYLDDRPWIKTREKREKGEERDRMLGCHITDDNRVITGVKIHWGTVGVRRSGKVMMTFGRGIRKIVLVSYRVNPLTAAFTDRQEKTCSIHDTMSVPEMKWHDRNDHGQMWRLESGGISEINVPKDHAMVTFGLKIDMKLIPNYHGFPGGHHRYTFEPSLAARSIRLGVDRNGRLWKVGNSRVHGDSTIASQLHDSGPRNVRLFKGITLSNTHLPDGRRSTKHSMVDLYTNWETRNYISYGRGIPTFMNQR